MIAPPRSLLAVLSLGAATVLVGCGGGSGTSTRGQVEPRPLTRARWVRRADTDCRRTAAAIAPLRDEFGRFVGRDDLEMAGIKVRLIVFHLEENGESLRRLGLPTEDAKTAREVEGRLERTIEQNIDLAEALEAGEASAAARLQVAIHQTQKAALASAHEVGLQVCGTE